MQERRDSRSKKIGRSWKIPVGEISKDKKKPLPIGVSDFKSATTNYYYVDKTLLIKDFLDNKPIVSLFTRPRRFGKTLNMDMLRVFFEKTDNDTSVYFKDKKIWKYGSEYTKTSRPISCHISNIQGCQMQKLGRILSENTKVDLIRIHSS